MPYLYFRIPEGCSPEQKKKIAEDANSVIDKYIGPPPFLKKDPTDTGPMKTEYHMVEIPRDNISRGGQLLRENSFSAYVVVNVMGKRPRDLKGSIAKEVTQAVAGQLGLPPDSQGIIVEIVETAENNISHGGKLTIDSIPPELRKV